MGQAGGDEHLGSWASGSFLVLRCIIWSRIISFWCLFLIFWQFSFNFQCNLGQAGELSIWEFSGVESYHMVYDHFVGNTNCIHTVVFNVEDKPEVQLAQVRYWLHFLQSRVPPVEPLGEYTPFISRFFSVNFLRDFVLQNFTNLNYFKLNEQLFGCQLYKWLSS